MTGLERLGAVAGILLCAIPPQPGWANAETADRAMWEQELATASDEGQAQSADPAPTPAEQTPEPGQSGRSELTDPREAELDALAAEVAGELRCPVCRNQSVLESNAELSREMQDVVRERLAGGESPEQVRAYFVSRYGEWILLKPTARGVNLAVYLLPLGALVGGVILVRGRLRKWAAEGVAAPAEARAEDQMLSADNETWLREAIREG